MANKTSIQAALIFLAASMLVFLLAQLARPQGAGVEQTPATLSELKQDDEQIICLSAFAIENSKFPCDDVLSVEPTCLSVLYAHFGKDRRCLQRWVAQVRKATSSLEQSEIPVGVSGDGGLAVSGKYFIQVHIGNGPIARRRKEIPDISKAAFRKAGRHYAFLRRAGISIIVSPVLEYDLNATTLSRLARYSRRYFGTRTVISYNPTRSLPTSVQRFVRRQGILVERHGTTHGRFDIFNFDGVDTFGDSLYRDATTRPDIDRVKLAKIIIVWIAALQGYPPTPLRERQYSFKFKERFMECQKSGISCLD